jgi:hypothetical protein
VTLTTSKNFDDYRKHGIEDFIDEFIPALKKKFGTSQMDRG